MLHDVVQRKKFYTLVLQKCLTRSEFEDLVKYARENNYLLLSLIIDKTYFFARFIDSKRFKARQEKIDQEKEDQEKEDQEKEYEK